MASTTWDDVVAREVPCRRCKGRFRVPAAIGSAELAEIRRLLEKGEAISAVLLIREKTGSGLADAKAMYEHVSIFRGQCRECHEALPEGVVSDCTRCGAFNIDA